VVVDDDVRTPQPGREPRRVVVTGGGSGIGLSVAEAFAGHGDRVAIVGRDEKRLSAAIEQSADAPGELIAVSGDVASGPGARQILRQAVEAIGGVEILVNNAGICIEELVVETSDEAWRALVDTNLSGAFYMARETGRLMIDQGRGGVILNTSSINAPMPERGYVPYSMTKAAIDCMTQGLSLELAEYGIRVCGVRPGYIETPMLGKVLEDSADLEAWREEETARVALGRFGTGADCAGAFLFLASPAASYITGASVTVDGGRLLT